MTDTAQRIALGVDVGGTGIKAAPVDLADGRLVGDRLRIDTPRPATPDRVVDVVRQLVAAHHWTGSVGVCVPAVVQRGVVRTAANIDPAWVDCDAGRLLSDRLDRRVPVVNDADAAGIAEMTWGAGRGRAGVVLCVTFGTGIEVLIPTLAFFYGIPVIRIARAATHDVVARDFVSAARARGHGRMSIIRRELLPNVLDTLMVEGAMRWSWMLLAFSSLSFLGFGVSPPTPDWGLMIADARGFMSFAPLGVLGPVIALSSLIIGINLTADALAKALGIDRAQKAPI
ncbi:MAG: ROK family protein [Ilumatobacteraceae bacterium]